VAIKTPDSAAKDLGGVPGQRASRDGLAADVVFDAATEAGGVAGDGTGADRHGEADVGDAAAAVAGGVPGQGAAAGCQPGLIPNAPAVVSGVAGQRAAADRQRAEVEDAAADRSGVSR